VSYNNELTGQIVLDVETVGAPDCDGFLPDVEAPSNYKDPQKIAEYCSRERTKQIAAAGLDADLNEIVAVGFLHPEYATAGAVYTRAEADEGFLIEMLLNAIGDRCIVGFNSLQFDLPVLMRRAQYLGISCPEFNLDKYRSPHLDLLERLTFRGRLKMRSLSFYCKRFGIPHDDSVSGKDITQLVAENDWKTVADHCRSDVEATAALARRLGWVKTVSAQAVA
jgi:DNA polymerase elongation subunit (family B)